MNDQIRELITIAYAGFNAGDFDDALRVMHPDVDWPKAFEGGYVSGKGAVRAYWIRQRAEITPQVEVLDLEMRDDGRLQVQVHQVVKDLQGQTILEANIEHVYTLEDGLLRRMDIEG